MPARRARGCLSVCNCTVYMLQRTRWFFIPSRPSRLLDWVHAGLVCSFGGIVGDPRIILRGRLDLACAPLSLGQALRLIAQLSKCLCNKGLSLIGRTQGAETGN